MEESASLSARLKRRLQQKQARGERHVVQNNRVSPKIDAKNGQTRLLYTLSGLYRDHLAKISVQQTRVH
jgi:hypothetical protein